jgi:hypothetical protein
VNYAVAQINGSTYLYLRTLSEPKDNELEIVLEEAGSGPKDGISEIRGPFSETRPIVHGPNDRVFKVSWKSYVAYSIRNESYVVKDDYEQFEGGLFVIFSRSRYLDFVAKSTFASDDYPGPIKHWGIFCLNHIIDVVSVHAPEIEIVRA